MSTRVTAQPMHLGEPAGWDVVDVSIGPSGDPVLLLWERPASLPLDPDEARHPGITVLRRRHAGPNRFRVLHQHRGGTVVLEVPETEQDYLRAQPLPGGDYLLIRGRTGDEGPTADVYAANGERRRSWQTGGGRVHYATAGGQVWVGYGDQAVVEGRFFGGLGRHGAACFDVAGHLLVGFNDLAAQQGIEPIFDCYAMNVASDAEVWL